MVSGRSAAGWPALTQARLGGAIDSRARQRWAFMTGVAHHDDRDLFLVDWAEHRGGSCGRHPRPRPDRVVHLRHHLFAFARRLVAAGAAQLSELVRRWADVLGGRVARVGRTPAATGDCRVDDARVVRGGSYFLRPIDAAASTLKVKAIMALVLMTTMRSKRLLLLSQARQVLVVRGARPWSSCSQRGGRRVCRHPSAPALAARQETSSADDRQGAGRGRLSMQASGVTLQWVNGVGSLPDDSRGCSALIAASTLAFRGVVHTKVNAVVLFCFIDEKIFHNVLPVCWGELLPMLSRAHAARLGLPGFGGARYCGKRGGR